MKQRKNTKSVNGKKIGRPRTLTEAERKAKADAHLARLKELNEKRKKDPKYRAEIKRRTADRKMRLEADAELGQLTKLFISCFAALIETAKEIYEKAK